MNQLSLSMPLSRKILTTVRNDYCNLISVSSQKTSVTEKENLSDYVKRIRRENKLSTTEVERQSGNQISSSYVTRIENDPNKKVSPEKIKALAKGLNVPEHEILKVAGFKNSLTPDSDPTFAEIGVFFSGYDELTEEDKDEIKPFLQMLASDIRRRLFDRKADKNKKSDKKR